MCSKRLVSIGYLACLHREFRFWDDWDMEFGYLMRFSMALTGKLYPVRRLLS